MNWKTWAIDEDRVERSDHSWEQMFYKQLRVPMYASVLVGIVSLWAENATYAMIGMAIVLVLSWPAYSSYVYMQRERDRGE